MGRVVATLCFRGTNAKEVRSYPSLTALPEEQGGGCGATLGADSLRNVRCPDDGRLVGLLNLHVSGHFSHLFLTQQ